MNNQSKPDFSVGEWGVTPDEGTITRDGEIVHLEPKVMEVLVYFTSRLAEVITREELERDVWKGAIVGYDAITKTIIKLRKALQDDARQPRYIKTIAKKGYQLIAQVNVSTDRNEATPAISTHSPSAQKNSQTNVKLVLGAISVLLMLWLMFGLLPVSTTSELKTDGMTENTLDNMPSIVVLPFKNLSDDLRQDYFINGITDDMITDLSKIGSLRVIARQSAYHFKTATYHLKR